MTEKITLETRDDGTVVWEVTRGDYVYHGSGHLDRVDLRPDGREEVSLFVDRISLPQSFVLDISLTDITHISTKLIEPFREI